MSTEVVANKSPALAKAAPADPIFIDLGKKRRKDIRNLRRGRQGKLMDKIHEVLEQLKEGGAVAGAAQPIVVVVRERRRRSRGMGRMFR